MWFTPWFVDFPQNFKCVVYVAFNRGSISAPTCHYNHECVPEDTCHPRVCFHRSIIQPEPATRLCTRNCEPGSMDCGAGHCVCEEGKCAVDWTQTTRRQEHRCHKNDDCVAAHACHPSSCVHHLQLQVDPSDVERACTANCAPGTMDCGAGHCVCEEGKCAVEWTPRRQEPRCHSDSDCDGADSCGAGHCVCEQGECAVRWTPQTSCNNDDECVKEDTCHPRVCLHRSIIQPERKSRVCTKNCERGSMDCGAGHCVCEEGKCAVKWTPRAW